MTDGPNETRDGGARWRILVLLAAAELLGMSLWFSASALTPQISEEWRLTESGASWLTLAVQLGFVAGTVASALLNLPDVLSARRLFAVSACLGAASNASFALFAENFNEGAALRFLTGMFLAGVYPPGIRNGQKLPEKPAFSPNKPMVLPSLAVQVHKKYTRVLINGC